jgi:hypothetical protein
MLLQQHRGKTCEFRYVVPIAFVGCWASAAGCLRQSGTFGLENIDGAAYLNRKRMGTRRWLQIERTRNGKEHDLPLVR